MSAKKRIDGPRWRAFAIAANARIVARPNGYASEQGKGAGWQAQVAAEIVAHGDGPAFLKAVRRGRGTQQQNLRYQLLREVEQLAGDGVKRRRPASNIPDALALKPAGEFKLEG